MITYIQELKQVKRILAVALAICMIFALSACNDNTDKNPVEPNSSTGSSANNSQSGGSSSTDSGSSSQDSNTAGSGNSNNGGTVTQTGTVIGQKYNITEDIVLPRSDYAEKRPDNVQANMYAPVKGKKDAEAEALKQKILNAPNTEEIYKITGTKYYISPGGNDDNDGKSPENAFQTTQVLSQIAFKPGDAVLFERNSIFRLDSPVIAVEGVTYGSYGKGDKPQLLASPYNYASGNFWEPTKAKNIWKASYVYERISCAVYDYGEVIGALRRDPVDLKDNGDFYTDLDSGEVLIYCDKGNPAAVYESIEFAPARVIFNCDNKNDYVIDNLCLKFGSFGVRSYGENKNVKITNCEMAYIGGFSYRDDGVRLGNAVEIGGGANGVQVTDNWIYQTYDTAVTWQGDSPTGYVDVDFSRNLLEYNVCDYEFFCTNGTRVAKNYKMDNNIMRFTGGGWGNRANDAGIRGIEGIIRAVTFGMTLSNISFQNNIIDTPIHRVIDWHNDYTQLGEVKVGGNEYYIQNSVRTTKSVIFKYNLDADEYKDYSKMDFSANSYNEFVTAIDRFDDNMKVFWYD